LCPCLLVFFQLPHDLRPRPAQARFRLGGAAFYGDADHRPHRDPHLPSRLLYHLPPSSHGRGRDPDRMPSVADSARPSDRRIGVPADPDRYRLRRLWERYAVLHVEELTGEVHERFLPHGAHELYAFVEDLAPVSEIGAQKRELSSYPASTNPEDQPPSSG